MDEDEGISGPGTESSTLSQIDSQLDLTELQKHEKSSLLRLLTNFWGERSSSGWTPLEYPFSAGEHVWGDSDIIVREDEPSSIIALALSSTDYTAKLRAFRKLTESTTPEEIEASIERNLLFPKNTNIRYAFENRGVRAQCKIFYAESFDALRRKCGVAERFVESMSRCLKWDSKGGKTKSLFLKTLDDRFVLKSLSPVEVNAFFKFAPDYFAFTHATLFNGLPSVIARMLGLFQVTIRNPASGMEFNWFMIVMENLFYDREPNRRFDLKGSMRNRKIESTGERDEVLLDENLVDIIFEKPIFVRQHTMKLLKASVWNDTLFLSKQNVMDYSLMAGFEDDMREIVVGIIGKYPVFCGFVLVTDLNVYRLYPHLHLGQETRDMDQRPRQEQTHSHISQGLPQSFPHRHEQVHPPGSQLLVPVPWPADSRPTRAVGG
jgi:1-phosphatidylinositol-3-phosphate 5-kinase